MIRGGGCCAGNHQQLAVGHHRARSIRCAQAVRDIRTCDPASRCGGAAGRVDCSVTGGSEEQCLSVGKHRGSTGVETEGVIEGDGHGAVIHPGVGRGDVAFGECACRVDGEDRIIGELEPGCPALAGSAIQLPGARPGIGCWVVTQPHAGLVRIDRHQQHTAIREKCAVAAAEEIRTCGPQCGREGKRGPGVRDRVIDLSLAAAGAEFAAGHKDAAIAQDLSLKLQTCVKHRRKCGPGAVDVTTKRVRSETVPRIANQRAAVVRGSHDAAIREQDHEVDRAGCLAGNTVPMLGEGSLRKAHSRGSCEDGAGEGVQQKSAGDGKHESVPSKRSGEIRGSG